MKYPISIEALEVLDAIARKGSFAAAAETLYRVPSAITYTVKKLEQELNVTLFRKQGRRSVLTPAGEVLVQQGRDILAATERLALTAQQTQNGWEPRLNIAFDTLLGFDLLYPIIEEFYALYPDIEINLSREVLGGSWEAIDTGRADIIVGAAEAPVHSQGLCCQPLTDLEWVFAVAKGHPLAKLKRALVIEDIAAYRMVVVKDSSRDYAPMHRRIFSQRPSLRVPDMVEKLRAQQHGLGVGFLPLEWVKPALQRGDMVALELQQQEQPNMLQLAWKANNQGRARRWFCDRIQAVFSSDAVIN